MAIRGQGIEGGWIASLAAARPPRFREPVRLRPGNRVQLGLVQRSRGPWGARDANCFGLGSESDAKPKQFARTAPARAIRPILPRCLPAKCGEPSMETGPATAYPAHAPSVPGREVRRAQHGNWACHGVSGPTSLGAWPRKAASPAWKLGPPRAHPAQPPSTPGRAAPRPRHGRGATRQTYETRAIPASAQPASSASSPKPSTGPSAPVPCRPPRATVSAPQARMRAVKS